MEWVTDKLQPPIVVASLPWHSQKTRHKSLVPGWRQMSLSDSNAPGSEKLAWWQGGIQDACQPQEHSQEIGPLGLAWIRVPSALGWVPFMGWMQQWGFGFQSVLVHNFPAGSFLPSNGCVALGDGRGSL